MTIQPTEPIADRTTATPILDHADRCDRCRAQAYVLVLFSEHELLFCAHHYRKFEPALLKLDTVIIDERHRLTEAVKDDGHFVEGKPSR